MATMDILSKAYLLNLFIACEFHDPLDVIIRELVKVGHGEWEVTAAMLYSEVFRNLTHDLVKVLAVRRCTLCQCRRRLGRHQPL